MTSVETLAKKNLVTATPDESVLCAVERMTARRVGAILVVEGDALVGIFSERDALARVLARGLDPAVTQIGSVSTPTPWTVRLGSPVRECADLVKRNGVRHVPVVDDFGHPVGMVSSRDFLAYVVDELEGLIEKANLELRREELTDPYSLL